MTTQNIEDLTTLNEFPDAGKLKIAERARELLAKITPGPWYRVFEDDRMFMASVYITDDPVMSDDPHEKPEKVICVTLYQAERCATHESQKWDENAEFIAAAPELVRGLVDALESAKRCTERAEKYMHKAIDERDAENRAKCEAYSELERLRLDYANLKMTTYDQAHSAGANLGYNNCREEMQPLLEAAEADAHAWKCQCNTQDGDIVRLKEKLDAAEAVNRQFHETIIRLGEELAEAKIRTDQLKRERDVLANLHALYFNCADRDKFMECAVEQEKCKACWLAWAAEQARSGEEEMVNAYAKLAELEGE